MVATLLMLRCDPNLSDIWRKGHKDKALISKPPCCYNRSFRECCGNSAEGRQKTRWLAGVFILTPPLPSALQRLPIDV